MDTIEIKIVPLVTNKIVINDNISKIKNFLEFVISINKLIYDYNKYKPKIKHFKIIYKEVKLLLDIKLSDEVLDKLSYEGTYNQSINPAHEIVEILNNITNKHQIPEDCVFIVIKYKNIILGYISVIIDSRTTLNDGKVGYFIGIRKSSFLMAAQQYPKLIDKNYKNIITEFRLSETIIPIVEDYAKSLNCVYLVTSPLLNMMKILTKHYGFTGFVPNIMKSTYNTPCFLISEEQEVIIWKKINHDKINDKEKRSLIPESSQNKRRELKAVYGDDGWVKLYDVETGNIVSVLGQYAIYDPETGKSIKSAIFNGSNVVYLLNDDGDLLHTITINDNYQVVTPDKIFSSIEMNLLNYGYGHVYY